MKMYTTSRFDNKIEEIEATRTTAKSVWYMGDSWGKTEERRAARQSSYERYFDTWEEAHAYLLGRTERALAQARRQLQNAQGEHGNVKGMKQEPTS